MIIDDLYVKRMPITPPETDPPLPIDPNAVLAFSIPLQSLELIRARNREVLQISSRVELLQLHQRPLLNVSWNTLGVLATPDPLGFLASKGLDHTGILILRISNVKRYYKRGTIVSGERWSRCRTLGIFGGTNGQSIGYSRGTTSIRDPI